MQEQIKYIMQHKLSDRGLSRLLRAKYAFMFTPCLAVVLVINSLRSRYVLKGSRGVGYLYFSRNQGKMVKYLSSAIPVNLIFSKELFLSIAFCRYRSDSKLLRQIWNNRHTDALRENWLQLVWLAFISGYLKKKMSEFKVIVLSNDHSIISRFAHMAAKDIGCKVAYIQHAPVNSSFPPLDFDSAYLFSQSSLDAYDCSMMRPHTVNLLCDLRLSDFITFSSKKRPDYSVLLCVNELDDLNIVESYVDFLSDHGYSVRVRMHPLDKRRLPTSKISVSENSLADDLLFARYVLVADSAVIIEAKVAGCKVFMVDFGSLHDHYGYVEKGLIKVIPESSEHLLRMILDDENVWDDERLEYFIGNTKNHKGFIDELNNNLILMSNG